MSRVEILQEMQLVIQEQLDREDIVLTEATKLNDLGVDSIEFMEFIINLEDEFSLEISDNTIDHSRTEYIVLFKYSTLFL